MSTRCVINFTDGKRIDAKVYRHSDGYPDGPNGVPADLKHFFADVVKQTKDTRFDDPSYLAAKYVVWQADQNRQMEDKYHASLQKAGDPRFEQQHESTSMLDFLGVGIVLEDPGDIEYRYFVDCSTAKPPKVRWEEC